MTKQTEKLANIRFPLAGRDAWKEVRGLFYVYSLSFCGVVFYVGKGHGKRMLQHVADARNNKIGEKCQHIREAFARGVDVEYQIVGAFSLEHDAYRLEAELIQATPNLTNVKLNNKNSMTAAQKEQAHWSNILKRMKTWAQWRESITASQSESLKGHGITPRRFYALVKLKCKQYASGQDANMEFLRSLGFSSDCEV
jgi:hypothetical protein